MTMINCSECNHQVSDRAASCPNCGNPVSSVGDIKSTGTPLTTVQETSKHLKKHIIFSVLILLIGIVWFIGIIQTGSTSMSPIPSLLIFLGMAWFVCTRIRIWWHHK